MQVLGLSEEGLEPGAAADTKTLSRTADDPPALGSAEDRKARQIRKGGRPAPVPD